VSVGVQPDIRRAAIAVPVTSLILAAIIALGLHVNLSSSAPRGQPR
jgi:hypothetical protein